MALIEAENLTKNFGPLRAVDGLSLKVELGETYGLVGPDGAGKTTILRLFCGSLLPNSGAARIAGFDAARKPEQARSHLGYLPQRFSLYEEMTVLENLRFFAEVRGLVDADWRPRTMEILSFVGLEEYTGRLAGHLSGGMKQKLGLAAALVHRPEALLLDEPTTGVDPVTRQDFWHLILSLAAQKRAAVLVSTPYMDEAARCSRVGFLRKGRLLVEGPPKDLQARMPFEVLELAGRPLALLRRLASEQSGVQDVLMFGDRLHLFTSKGQHAAIVANLRSRIPLQGGEISRLRLIPPQLEDVFIALQEERS
jgi:ABC-2 type transport system ATP-binding protein